jgi:hypothetical protein
MPVRRENGRPVLCERILRAALRAATRKVRQVMGDGGVRYWIVCI